MARRKLNAWDGKTTKNFRIYNIWYGMKRRCYQEGSVSYNRYGAIGIRICEEWKDDFGAFYDWSLENGYRDDLTIDRIDTTKDYSPENCRWTDYTTQIVNRKRLKTNTSGKTGVSYDRGYWIATITRHKKRTPLGHYKKIEDAIYARERAERYYEKHGTMEGYK